MAVLSQASLKILNGGDLTASTNYAYTANASIGSDDGWFNAKYNNIIVQIGVATLTATSFDYRIEGRANASSRAGNILTASIDAVTSIDTFITVTENIGQIRLGHKVSTNATPNNIYSRLILTEMS